MSTFAFEASIWDSARDKDKHKYFVDIRLQIFKNIKQ